MVELKNKIKFIFVHYIITVQITFLSSVNFLRGKMFKSDSR